MGDKTSASSDWKTERIQMSHLANFSRSSSYVRSLVRQQFQQQSDQPATAWERLRERLAKSGQDGSFDGEEEILNFRKKKERLRNNDQTNDTEDDEGEEEEKEEKTVYAKTASPDHKNSETSDDGKGKSTETPQSSSGKDSSSPSNSRRLSAPQVPPSNLDTEKNYTLGSVDAHSKILNRRLSLAENVIKNYSKYIRTPDVDQPLIKIEDDSSESGREKTSKGISSEAISEEDSSPLLEVKLGSNPGSPVSSASGDFLAVPEGSSYSTPPSPVDKRENLFSYSPAPARRKSFCGAISEEQPLVRSRTDVTSGVTKKKAFPDTVRRSSKTGKVRIRSEKGSTKSRDEAIKELRDDHKQLKNNKLLNRRTGRKKETLYQELQRDQERRARETEIFNREMEAITKELKGINSRLDERIKVLNCYDPPARANAKLHRIVHAALAGIPFSK